jgi:hypothetical protein
MSQANDGHEPNDHCDNAVDPSLEAGMAMVRSKHSSDYRNRSTRKVSGKAETSPPS